VTFELDSGILEAKLEVLQKLKGFIQYNHILTKMITEISNKHDIDFKELWAWTLEQMFSEELAEIVPPNTTTKKAKEAPVVKVAKVEATKETVAAKEAVAKPRPVAKPNVLRRKISDPVVLFKQASTDKKLQILQTTKDPAILAAGIVDQNRHVRLQAVRNEETPQKLIETVVLRDANLKVQRVAIRFVEDQTFLGRIAISGLDIEVRQKSIRKLTDKKILQKIVQGRFPPTLVKAAGLTISELI